MNQSDPTSESSVPPWHALSPEEALSALGASARGLTSEEAARRLERHGPNRLPPPPPRSPWTRLLVQFHNVLIYVLLAAGLVTSALGHWVDAGVIFGVVAINAVIGFLQEGKAERAMEAVRRMLSPQALVSRDHTRVTLPAEGLVPGDVVHLQSGDRVPADLRLVWIHGLRIDEAILTGESVPVEKAIGPVARDAVLGDRRPMAYSGTLVTFGQGSGVVAGTGRDTEIGRISDLLAKVEPLTTPLLRQLAGFGRWLSVAIVALATLAFGFGTLVRDYSATEMFLAAVGLAVAAIPEGLPAIITITLAIGVQRMSQRNAIVRRLPAVETLGSVTVICSDKTGTLTRNEMTVQSIVLAGGPVEVSGSGYEPRGGFTRGGVDLRPQEDADLGEVARAAMLCNDASVRETPSGWRLDGDPTEGALVVLGMKAGLQPQPLSEQLPRTDVIPFESEHRFMATLHHDHQGRAIVYVKGAPEVLLPRCKAVRMSGADVSLDVNAWMMRVESVAGSGQRTLAIATKRVRPEQTVITFDDVDDDLCLIGIVGIIDPPREEAIEAVGRCGAAGIRVKMITGDHAATARAVAQRVGLVEPTRACTGDELNRLDPIAFESTASAVNVFARVSPEHKLMLVTALQAQGEVVAMTGDGVNDAPALKRADVGIAMGVKGTEAAKEAAEMVLADDNFATIGQAVEEGRTVYDNIRKAILFILPTNGGEALTILAAILLGRVLPVTAAQILWVNMVTAVTLALSLAFEPPENDVMRRPPRAPDQPILTPFLWWRIGLVSAVMVSVTFGLFVFEREHGASIETARTVAVNTIVMLEVFYLFATRYLNRSALNRDGLLGSRYVLISIAAVVCFQLAFTYAPPMETFFQTRPIDGAAWIRIIALSSLVLFVVELEKLLVRRFRDRGRASHRKDGGPLP